MRRNRRRGGGRRRRRRRPGNRRTRLGERESVAAGSRSAAPHAAGTGRPGARALRGAAGVRYPAPLRCPRRRSAARPRPFPRRWKHHPRGGGGGGGGGTRCVRRECAGWRAPLRFEARGRWHAHRDVLVIERQSATTSRRQCEEVVLSEPCRRSVGACRCRVEV